MSTNPPSEPTIAYYESHAEQFAKSTLDVGMQSLYEPFLALLPQSGHILDAGCGSGRDSLCFLRRGYRVTAFDASPAMARIATEITGQPTAVLRFQDMSYEDEFDGIWACASLLHVPGRDMDDVFSRFTHALRGEGVWYVSFKRGTREEVRHGRLFTDFTADRLRQTVQRHPRLNLIQVWETDDARPEREGQKWLNCLVRKKG
jgi:SAM-dependent methyltransferase